jgi:hypothetical protein
MEKMEDGITELHEHWYCTCRSSIIPTQYSTGQYQTASHPFSKELLPNKTRDCAFVVPASNLVLILARAASRGPNNNGRKIGQGKISFFRDVEGKEDKQGTRWAPNTGTKRTGVFFDIGVQYCTYCTVHVAIIRGFVGRHASLEGACLVNGCTIIDSFILFGVFGEPYPVQCRISFMLWVHAPSMAKNLKK